MFVQLCIVFTQISFLLAVTDIWLPCLPEESGMSGVEMKKKKTKWKCTLLHQLSVAESAGKWGKSFLFCRHSLNSSACCSGRRVEFSWAYANVFRISKTQWGLGRRKPKSCWFASMWKFDQARQANYVMFSYLRACLELRNLKNQFEGLTPISSLFVLSIHFSFTVSITGAFLWDLWLELQ